MSRHRADIWLVGAELPRRADIWPSLVGSVTQVRPAHADNWLRAPGPEARRDRADNWLPRDHADNWPPPGHADNWLPRAVTAPDQHSFSSGRGSSGRCSSVRGPSRLPVWSGGGLDV